MVAKTEYIIDSTRLDRAIKEASTKAKDLTIPLNAIGIRWRKSNQSLFTLKGPGKYKDLTPFTKRDKQAEVGFIYPILKRTGRLAKSLTNGSSPDSINVIVNGKTLFLGTKVEYAPQHQFGDSAKNLPARPFLFLFAEQQGDNAEDKALDIYGRILFDYIEQISQPIGE